MSATQVLRSRIHKQLPALLPTDEQLPILLPIDSGFKTRVGPPALIIGLPYALEPLLDELNDLLGRCLISDRYKSELEEKAVSYWLSHTRDVELTSKRLEMAQLELRYDMDNGTHERDLARKCVPVIETVHDQKAESVAWRDPAHPMATARTDLSKQVTGFLSPNATEAVQPLAEDLELNRILYEKLSAEADERVAQAELHRATSAEAIANLRANYLTAMGGLKIDELKLELEAIKRRQVAALDASSPLNYGNRLVEILKMFDADFAAAIVRAEALSMGLKQIHQIELPCPPAVDSGMLSSYVTWARVASEALFATTERAFKSCCTLSLKETLSGNQWSDLISGNEIRFELKADQFLPTGKKGLLSALRVEVKTGSGASGVLAASVTLPTMPADREPCAVRCGDVLVNDEFGRTGRAAGRLLLNRTPIGEWRLKLHKSFQGVPGSVDVFLALEMTVA